MNSANEKLIKNKSKKKKNIFPYILKIITKQKRIKWKHPKEIVKLYKSPIHTKKNYSKTQILQSMDHYLIKSFIENFLHSPLVP